MTQPEVNVQCGRLRGKILKDIDGSEFNSFKGIPYAKPPVGKLRFQDPIPAEKWTGTRDAFDYGQICAQHDVMLNFVDGSDDCLYLNVYTKSLKPTELRPVMVYIHGGGFFFGSGNDTLYGPELLMKKDIVLVTINYRLGVLGFLNLEDEIAPGNQGLKDQVMALQWVRDNIINFGGDPKNVTIFGESAGGASVHYLTLSPLAEGLFHKAISQSGVAINPWASVPGEAKEQAYKLCEILGKKLTDHKEIIKFLRSVDVKTLNEAQQKVGYEKVFTQCQHAFSPGVDAKSPNPFLPLPIEIAAKQGANVPYIIGHNDREGILLLKMFELSPLKVLDKNKDFESFIHQRTRNWLKKYNMSIEDLKYLYFEKEQINNENINKMSDVIGDMNFIYGIHDVIKTQVQHNSAPTYMYKFTYDKGYSSHKELPGATISGTTHMDELFYLFNMKFYFENFKWETMKKGSSNYKVMEQMLEMWTNFAKTGVPTPTKSETVPLYWKPVVDGTVLRYLNIGEELRMEKMLNIHEKLSS